MADDVWYFAYGSNLHPEVRERRRGLLPSAVMPAVLPEWRLAFELPGLPLIEPAMASILPAPGREVHGLLLCFSPAQLVALERSEGSGRFYEKIEVETRSYAGTRVRALAFKALPEWVVAERLPSRRYLEIIREGAHRSGLHPDYCRQLDALPHAPSRVVDGPLGALAIDGLTMVSRTRWHELAFRYLAWTHRMEAGGGPMSTAPGKGLMLAPLVALGLGARAGSRVFERLA